jgi:hypothetical protein
LGEIVLPVGRYEEMEHFKRSSPSPKSMTLSPASCLLVNGCGRRHRTLDGYLVARSVNGGQTRTHAVKLPLQIIIIGLSACSWLLRLSAAWWTPGGRLVDVSKSRTI